MAHVPVPSFSESADGMLYMARGDQPMRRWDGLLDDFVDAGVPAPTSKPNVASTSGSGDFVGEYYCYVRFLDSRGLVSNLSPISDKLDMDSRSGTITNVKWYKVPDYWIMIYPYPNWPEGHIVTSEGHGLVEGERIKISGVVGDAGANGTWKITLLGMGDLDPADHFKILDSRSTGDYRAGGMWNAGSGAILYSNIEVPTDSRVTKRQILRNKDGNVNTFYIDIEDETLEGTTFTSEKDDDELGAAVPLRAEDGTDLNIARHGEPPDFKSVVVHHYSRMFAGVDLDYSEGAVSVTKDSTTVTGIGTIWTASMAGRNFYPLGANNTKAYSISTVDTGAQTLTLSEDYDGDTEPYIEYSIRTEIAERSTIHYSEPDLSESWDRNKKMFLTEDPLAGRMTGLMSLNASLYILYQYRMYRLSYVATPAADGKIFLNAWRGCVNHRCWVSAEGFSYLLDEKGVYRYDGNSIEDLSDMIQPMFTGQHKWAINWLDTRYFHASHSPQHHTIRWFVCLQGFKYPYHALCYHYKHGRWWIEEYNSPISSSYTGEMDGKRQPFWGSTGRRVLAAGAAPLDGVAASVGGLNGTFDSSTRLKASDNTKIFQSNVIGCPVVVTSGRGKGQVRKIVGVSQSYHLVVDRPWVIRPDNTSKYQIGGFLWKYKTGHMRWIMAPGTKSVRGVELVFEPNTEESQLTLRKYQDFSSSAEINDFDRTSEEGDGAATTSGSADVDIDMTEPTGFVDQNFDSYQTIRSKSNKFVRIELEGCPNTETHKLYEITIHGVGDQK
ncbi:MAG: hypothetical protein Unbinned1606contig1000_53 [Prokaryotic dsDNA virus sp.]|nr:MAG: hypothetical protein Unbinned1606contig1000_53 [Prokaryotic dsDNA virus sp.]|tara:strand:+ start:29248 stop:31584 length:2337 start_codon:yes stop_codon:yes gene_type:complete